MLSISKIKKKCLETLGDNGIGEHEIHQIESLLNLSLPDDFKMISEFFSGGIIGVFDNYSFIQGPWDNIIDETIKMRHTVGLPHHFIVLAEPPESLIVLNVKSHPSVIWCDSIDVDHLLDGLYESPPNTWNYYKDFFYEQLCNNDSDE